MHKHIPTKVRRVSLDIRMARCEDCDWNGTMADLADRGGLSEHGPNVVDRFFGEED